jgi:Na+-driven multidrug efflux pump
VCHSTVVVAEGAFRGSGDSKTPLVAASFAGFINLLLDPILMFPFKMGMMGAAAATALSQYAATCVYGWRMVRRGMLPQKNTNYTDTVSTTTTTTVTVPHVVKAILGANLAMLAKQGSLLVFYTYATALATRLGPAHVATHQVALSFFWLVTYVTDSGSVSGQVLMSQSMSLSDPIKVRSLTRYMIQYAMPKDWSSRLSSQASLESLLPSLHKTRQFVHCYSKSCPTWHCNKLLFHYVLYWKVWPLVAINFVSWPVVPL